MLRLKKKKEAGRRKDGGERGAATAVLVVARRWWHDEGGTRRRGTWRNMMLVGGCDYIWWVCVSVCVCVCVCAHTHTHMRQFLTQPCHHTRSLGFFNLVLLYKNEGWNLTQVPPKNITRRTRLFRHKQLLPCLLFTFNRRIYALFLVLNVVFCPFGHVPGKPRPWGGMFL